MIKNYIQLAMEFDNSQTEAMESELETFKQRLKDLAAKYDEWEDDPDVTKYDLEDQIEHYTLVEWIDEMERYMM